MCKIQQIMPICEISSDCHKEGCGERPKYFTKTEFKKAPEKSSKHKAFILDTDYYENDQSFLDVYQGSVYTNKKITGELRNKSKIF